MLGPNRLGIVIVRVWHRDEKTIWNNLGERKISVCTSMNDGWLREENWTYDKFQIMPSKISLLLIFEDTFKTHLSKTGNYTHFQPFPSHIYHEKSVSLPQCIYSGNCITSINVKDIHFYVPIVPKYRKFLRRSLVSAHPFTRKYVVLFPCAHTPNAWNDSSYKPSIAPSSLELVAAVCFHSFRENLPHWTSLCIQSKCYILQASNKDADIMCQWGPWQRKWMKSIITQIIPWVHRRNLRLDTFSHHPWPHVSTSSLLSLFDGTWLSHSAQARHGSSTIQLWSGQPL